MHEGEKKQMENEFRKSINKLEAKRLNDKGREYQNKMARNTELVELETKIEKVLSEAMELKDEEIRMVESRGAERMRHIRALEDELVRASRDAAEAKVFFSRKYKCKYIAFMLIFAMNILVKLRKV